MITIQAEEEDLRELMDEIGRRVGREILVDPDIHERVNVLLRNTPWHDAVQVIARMTKCEVEERSGVLVLTQPPRLTIQNDGCDLRAILQLIAADAGLEVVMGDSVQGPGPFFEILEMRWSEAFKLVCDEAGLHCVRYDGKILVDKEPFSIGSPNLVDDGR
jgi:hypothetical protein